MKRKKTFYKFVPQYDIEPYELALILANFPFWGDNMRWEIDQHKENMLGYAVMRHFQKVDD